jgi:phosphate starvation-inducible protein PhoH
MMRKTMIPRIGYLKVILAYERNLLDALMKLMHFDIFEYIMDKIWNIAINPLGFCGFAP